MSSLSIYLIYLGPEEEGSKVLEEDEFSIYLSYLSRSRRRKFKGVGGR